MMCVKHIIRSMALFTSKLSHPCSWSQKVSAWVLPLDHEPWAGTRPLALTSCHDLGDR